MKKSYSQRICEEMEKICGPGIRVSVDMTGGEELMRIGPGEKENKR